MPDFPALDDLFARQKAMTELAETLIDEKDVERIQQVAAELQRMGAELQAAAEAVAAATPGGALTGYAEVVLTAAQRERVEQATGELLETVRVPDPQGYAARIMPTTDPRIIEYYAMEEARRRKVAAQADAVVRSELEASLAAIEAQGTPELLAQLETLKADPNFAGGLLRKKE